MLDAKDHFPPWCGGGGTGGSQTVSWEDQEAGTNAAGVRRETQWVLWTALSPRAGAVAEMLGDVC